MRMRLVNVITDNGLPSIVEGRKVVIALLCGRAEDAQRRFSEEDDKLIGYKYKVRLKASDGGVKTHNIINTDDGKWYVTS